MAEMVSSAEQETRVATLLGPAVLRWKREKEQSSEISEIVSDSLPERLEFRPPSSISVTGQNDEATGLEETTSESGTTANNHVRGAPNKNRGPDRRSDLVAGQQAGRATGERILLRFQSFYCFMNRTLEAPLFEIPADGVLKRIEERTNQFNRNRQRDIGAAVWTYEFGNEMAFLIRLGGSLNCDEVMDNDQCRPDSVVRLATTWLSTTLRLASCAYVLIWSANAGSIVVCSASNCFTSPSSLSMGRL